jgi:cytoskeletal protein RodZ
VAQKKQKKRSWLRSLLLFIFTPIIIWIIAFLIWFFWRDIAKLFDKRGPAKTPPGVSRGTEKSQPRRDNKSQEKIPEEDRRKLDEILKNR